MQQKRNECIINDPIASMILCPINEPYSGKAFLGVYEYLIETPLSNDEKTMNAIYIDSRNFSMKAQDTNAIELPLNLQ